MIDEIVMAGFTLDYIIVAIVGFAFGVSWLGTIGTILAVISFCILAGSSYDE